MSAPEVRAGSATTTASVTATVSAGLAAVGAAANVLGLLILGASFVSDPGRYDNSLAVATALGAALLAVALGYGALQMLRRADEGRWMVLLASGAWLAFAALGLLAALTGYRSDYGIRWSAEGGTGVDIATATTGLPGVVTAFVHGDWLPCLVGSVVPLVIAAVAAVPATARWFATAPTS